jgi:hypothetical protein
MEDMKGRVVLLLIAGTAAPAAIVSLLFREEAVMGERAAMAVVGVEGVEAVVGCGTTRN